jgi:hypothetical protein
MSGGLSRRASVLAPVAIVARTAAARRSATIAAAIAVSGAGRAKPAATASATAWCAQPIRRVVPFGPGGSADLAARLVAQGSGERFAPPIVIEDAAARDTTDNARARAGRGRDATKPRGNPA